MKVLHVIPTLSLSYGGPSHAVRAMARGLSECGVEVTIAATHQKETRLLESPLLTSGATIGSNGVAPDVRRGPPSLKEFPRVAGPLFPSSFFYSPALARWLDENVAQFDLVHVHTLFNYPSNRACAAARKHGVPYIARPCGMLDPWSLRRRELKKKIWMALFERSNLNGAAALHFTSSEERQLTGPLGLKAPGFVVPLGVDEMPLERPKEKRAQKVVIFLSRIHPKKGFDVLIPALGELAKKRNDFRFVLAGGGEPDHERAIAQLLAANGVDRITTVPGFVQGAAKTALLAEADIFVLPSYQENFGLAVAEAMAAALPVIISDRVNVHPDITAYGAGLVTPPNSQEIAAALEKLLDDDSLRWEMGENGRRLVREKFAWSSITQQLVKLYNQIVSGRDATPELIHANSVPMSHLGSMRS